MPDDTTTVAAAAPAADKAAAASADQGGVSAPPTAPPVAEPSAPLSPSTATVDSTTTVESSTLDLNEASSSVNGSAITSPTNSSYRTSIPAALLPEGIDSEDALPSPVRAALKAAAAAAAGPTSRASSGLKGESKLPEPSQGVILGIAVVDFNHLVGPQIEYAHPPELGADEELSSTLPFLALPDGSHLSDEDFCYFHVMSSKLLPGRTIFGISCNRQIASDLLAVRGKEVTRGTVQKAVVVLAREPVFGPIREKLGVVTRAFFAQGDLNDTHILVDFHATLEAGLTASRGVSRASLSLGDGSAAGSGTATPDAESRQQELEKETVMYMGTSLRELVYKWRFKTLMLLKLLLLQRKIMFFGYPVERLCTYQYSLVSMIPGLLLALEDAGSPAMDSKGSARGKAESLQTSDRKSLLRFMGLPLAIFGENAFFQPYLPLQQIDMASKAHSFLVGTTNSIFRQQKECAIDVIVDLEHSSLEFLDQRLGSIVNLTPADRKWMDELVNVVTDTWNEADPTRPSTMQYVGSDDYLRAKFEDYICAMLSTVKYSDYLAEQGRSVNAAAPDSAVAAFGVDFIGAFKTTQAYALWDEVTDPMVFDLFEHKHPCEGKVSTLEDVGLRVQAGLYDLHLEEQLAPTREAIGAALHNGSQTAWRLANKFGNDLARIRREQLAKSEASAEAAAETQAATATKEKEARTAADLQAQAAAAAAQAGTQVRAAFGSFGNFLASKQKSYGWGASASTPAAPAKAEAALPPPPAKPAKLVATPSTRPVNKPAPLLPSSPPESRITQLGAAPAVRIGYGGAARRPSGSSTPVSSSPSLDSRRPLSASPRRESLVPSIAASAAGRRASQALVQAAQAGSSSPTTAPRRTAHTPSTPPITESPNTNSNTPLPPATEEPSSS